MPKLTPKKEKKACFTWTPESINILVQVRAANPSITAAQVHRQHFSGRCSIATVRGKLKELAPLKTSTLMGGNGHSVAAGLAQYIASTPAPYGADDDDEGEDLDDDDDDDDDDDQARSAAPVTFKAIVPSIAGAPAPALQCASESALRPVVIQQNQFLYIMLPRCKLLVFTFTTNDADCVITVTQKPPASFDLASIGVEPSLLQLTPTVTRFQISYQTTPVYGAQAEFVSTDHWVGIKAPLYRAQVALGLQEN